jgi:hypothetical protein
MFTLRRQHSDAFNQDIRRRFEKRMTAHVNQFFPDQCQALGAAAVHEWIAHGIEQAQRYGIVAERDVSKYIDIMFVFGRDFDAGSRYPWAAPILLARAVDPTHKLNYLFETARRAAATLVNRNGC